MVESHPADAMKYTSSSLVWLLLAFFCLFGQSSEPNRFHFEAREEAGIRRRSEVVTAWLDISGLDIQDKHFLLLKNERPLPSQSRLVESGEKRRLAVDFVENFKPFETHEYYLVISEDLADPEPTSRLRLESDVSEFRVRNGDVVSWTIQKDLSGLLTFAWDGLPYVSPESEGLYCLRDKGTKLPLPASPTAIRVQRSGPVVIALEFEYEDWPASCSSRILMEFVRTKSWIRLEWTIKGAVAGIEALCADLNLVLEGPESLLDFGGGDFVYTTVRKDQTAWLEAGPRVNGHVPWRVFHGLTENEVLVAAAPASFETPRVPGWAHAMDGKRCTAIAVKQFGELTRDFISFNGSGKMHLQRNYESNRAGDRSLVFWLHFVTMPLHIGARTGPRAMQEPIQVYWSRPTSWKAR